MPHSMHHLQSLYCFSRTGLMVDISLIARVITLEAEMAFFREEIDRLNHHIATLVSTIRTIRRAISNLQDVAVDAQDDELDPEFAEQRESNDTAEDSEGNLNGSDDRSDDVNDASDGANSGGG